MNKKVLAGLLCAVFMIGCSGCSSDVNSTAAPEDTQQAENTASGQGEIPALPASPASSAYANGMRIDNGKELYTATVREILTLEAPEEYTAAKNEYNEKAHISSTESETADGSMLIATSGNYFAGMSGGGLFQKWFWGGYPNNQGKMLVFDTKGNRIQTQPDAEPYSPAPAGMVTSIGCIAGQNGYVWTHLYDHTTEISGIVMMDNTGAPLAHLDVPTTATNPEIMGDKNLNYYTYNPTERACLIYDKEGELLVEDRDNYNTYATVKLTAFSDGSVGCFCTGKADGKKILPGSYLYLLDPAEGSVLLAQSREDYFFLTSFLEDSLLYADQWGIYRCTRAFQDAEPLYLWENHGIRASAVEKMSAEPDGSIDLIVSTRRGETLYLHLVPTPEGLTTLEIPFAVTQSNRSLYAESVYEFNKRHPAYVITLEVIEDETKLLTKLTAGAGPCLEKIFPEQDPQSFLELFFLRSLKDSCFVDDSGENALFQEGTFVRAADLAQKLAGEAQPGALSESIDEIRSGRCLGDFAYLDSPEQLAYYWAVYGEDVSLIGFPGRKGSCHFIRTTAPVTVRSSASEEEKKVAFWFLSEMLGRDSQESLSGLKCSVRRDLFEELPDAMPEELTYQMGGENVSIPVDRNAAWAKFKELYEQAVPYPVMPKDIGAAISEDLQECFLGKGAAEAAESLQNRVQLYLDEQR